MDAAAQTAGRTNSLVRLPTATVAVGLFLGLYVFGEAAIYLQSQITFDSWSGYPFALASALSMVALALAVIVINRPMAIFIGVAAGTASDIVQHYWMRRDPEYVYNWNLPRETPDEVLVDALLGSGVSLGIVGIAAFVAGRHLIPRASTAAGGTRNPVVQLPGTSRCLWLFGVLLGIGLVATQTPDGWFWREIIGRGTSAAGTLTFVALFLAVFAIRRPWTFLLVPVMLVQQLVTISITNGCFAADVQSSSCIDDMIALIGIHGVVLTFAYVTVAYVSRPWADVSGDDRPAQSGGDSISSSKLPAGSRT